MTQEFSKNLGLFFFEGGRPVVYHQIYIILVLLIHNIYKYQMFNYNWVIFGDMFRPLNGHLQANLEQC